MAKKKSKDSPIAMDEMKQTVRLYGKDVIKNAKVDQEVKLRIAGKVTEVGRERYSDTKRLYQEIEITTVKKMLTGADLDAKVSEKVNNA